MTNAAPAFASDYQRMWDLVRYTRATLLDDGLITLAEYTELCSAETRTTPNTGSPAPRRLESYDEVRGRMADVSDRVRRLILSTPNTTEGNDALRRQVLAAITELRR